MRVSVSITGSADLEEYRSAVKEEDWQLMATGIWFFWTKSENSAVGPKFVSDSDTRHASTTDWRQWAKEFAPQFVNDYSVLAELVVT